MTGHPYRRRQLTSAALALLLVAALLPTAALVSTATAEAGTAAGPRQQPLSAQLSRLERRTARIESMVKLMEGMAARYRQAMSCISWLPVTSLGDPDHSVGFHYDERDGTGEDYRPALAVQTKGARA